MTEASRATVAPRGWSGPRGLASTVAAPLILHGLTAGPLTERYVRRSARKQRRPRTTLVQGRGEQA
jgi:hypothetical protein